MSEKNPGLIINADVLDMTVEKDFVKLVPVKAKLMKHAFWITARDGKQEFGQAGDWLLMGVRGERWICTDKIFRDIYQPLAEAEAAAAAQKSDGPQPPAELQGEPANKLPA